MYMIFPCLKAPFRLLHSYIFMPNRGADPWNEVGAAIPADAQRRQEQVILLLLYII